MPPKNTVEAANILLTREQFLEQLIIELASAGEKIAGLDLASEYISLLGSEMGNRLDKEYRNELGTSALDPQQVAETLVDLKIRIQGGFSIESISSDKIVLINNACPFGKSVQGHESLCMMTSNVFGTITANNLGYAKVAIQESFARHNNRCRVVIHTRRTLESEVDRGAEYL